MRSGLAGDCQLRPVLHRGVEGLHDVGPGIVADAAFSENIGNLLVNAPFTGTDAADPLQQLEEVHFAEDLLALLQAFIVQHETFADVIRENLGGPDAKMGWLVWSLRRSQRQ